MRHLPAEQVSPGKQKNGERVQHRNGDLQSESSGLGTYISANTGKVVSQLPEGNRYGAHFGYILLMEIYMKRSITLLILCITASALFASGSEEPNADGWYEVQSLRDFDGVVLKTEADLILIPGKEYSVRIKSDRRDIDDLDVYVSGDDLIIRRQSLFSFLSFSNTPLEIEVILPRLSYAAITSSGSIENTGLFESGDLELRTTGSGNISIEAIADSLECKSTGSGDIKYTGRADTLLLRCTGAGNADIEIKANLVEVSLTGSGNAELRGGADRMDVRITGSGKLRANDFPVRNADVTLTGAGDAEVRVSGNLECRTTGSGSVYYSGNPEDLDFQNDGSGRIKKQ